MASKFLEDWYNERRNEFYSHVRPEHRALAERKERITKAELPATMNSYERRIVDPNLDNTTLLEKVEYCIRQSGQELGEFECPSHYNDAVELLYAPLLVKRLREADAEIARLRREEIAPLTDATGLLLVENRAHITSLVEWDRHHTKVRALLRATNNESRTLDALAQLVEERDALRAELARLEGGVVEAVTSPEHSPPEPPQ